MGAQAHVRCPWMFQLRKANICGSGYEFIMFVFMDGSRSFKPLDDGLSFAFSLHIYTWLTGRRKYCRYIHK